MSDEDARLMLPASHADVNNALLVVCGTVGISPAPGDRDGFRQRLSETAAILVSEGWTLGMIRTAARVLALSPEMAEKARYGRPLAASDFERVRLNGMKERTESAGLPDERVITTRSGYALKVARAKLYTATEALALWQASGEPGVLSESLSGKRLEKDGPAMFSPVLLPSGERRFRLK